MSGSESQNQKKKGLAKLVKDRSISNSLNNLDIEIETDKNHKIDNEDLKVLINPGTSTVPSVLLTSPYPLPFHSQDTGGNYSLQESSIIQSDVEGLLSYIDQDCPGSEQEKEKICSYSQPVQIPLNDRYIRKESLKEKSSLSSIELDKTDTSSDPDVCSSPPKENKVENKGQSRTSSFFHNLSRKSFKKKKSDIKAAPNTNRSKSPSPSPCQLGVPMIVSRSRSLSRLSDAFDNVHHICLTPTKTSSYLEGNIAQHPRTSSSSLMVASYSSISSSPSTCPNPIILCSKYDPENSCAGIRNTSRTSRNTRISTKCRTNTNSVSDSSLLITNSDNDVYPESKVETIVENQVTKSFSKPISVMNGRLPSVYFIKNKHKSRYRKNRKYRGNSISNNNLTNSSMYECHITTSDYGSKTYTDSSCTTPSNLPTSMLASSRHHSQENEITLHSSKVGKMRSGISTSWNTIDRSSFDDESSEEEEPQSPESETDELPSRRWSSLGQLSGGGGGTVVAPLFQVKLSEAKQKNYLFGGLGSLLGTNELNRYFPDRKVVVFIATWNMNGKEPPYSLDDFLLPDDMEHMPDMFVIGTQESGGDRTEWEVRLQTSIGPSHVLFHSALLGILHLTVFLRRDLVWFCSVPEDASHSLRPGTYFKTKGAVAISFQFFGTKMLFVNTHLFAHEEKLQQRVQNYKQIVHNIDLPRNLRSRTMTKPKDVTNRYDIVFWLGDLNFRLVGPRDEILERTKDNKTLQSNLEDILCFDQLNQSKNRGEIFHGFSEGKITFAPTFKFDVGTNHYDSSSKQRVPSYTDRILFKSTRDPIICSNYNSCPEFKTSDHKPVWGVFHIKVRPGKDDIPLAAGLFQRDVYLTALKRRRRFFHQPSSRNCQMQ